MSATLTSVVEQPAYLALIPDSLSKDKKFGNLILEYYAEWKAQTLMRHLPERVVELLECYFVKEAINGTPCCLSGMECVSIPADVWEFSDDTRGVVFSKVDGGVLVTVTKVASDRSIVWSRGFEYQRGQAQGDTTHCALVDAVCEVREEELKENDEKVRQHFEALQDDFDSDAEYEEVWQKMATK